MLAIFVLLLLSVALGVIIFSIGLVWLLVGEDREEAPAQTERPLSLSQSFARQLDAGRLWRALSAWMADKPLRIEDHNDRPSG